MEKATFPRSSAANTGSLDLKAGSLGSYSGTLAVKKQNISLVATRRFSKTIPGAQNPGKTRRRAF